MEVLRRSLSDLAAEITREHDLFELHATAALRHAIQAGAALLAAREQVPRGEWERWVDENCPTVASMARPYMRVASYRDALPPGVDTLAAGLKSLRGLPAFDGSGPSVHPPEVRSKALELTAQGLSRRVVASTLGIDKKCVERWAKADAPRSERHEGQYRLGRPSRREQGVRVATEREKSFGPIVLANGFRDVWDAQRRNDQHALAAHLHALAKSSAEWAAQIERRTEGGS
jgi:hypothetical protein